MSKRNKGKCLPVRAYGVGLDVGDKTGDAAIQMTATPVAFTGGFGFGFLKGGYRAAEMILVETGLMARINELRESMSDDNEESSEEAPQTEEEDAPEKALNIPA